MKITVARQITAWLFLGTSAALGHGEDLSNTRQHFWASERGLELWRKLWANDKASAKLKSQISEKIWPPAFRDDMETLEIKDIFWNTLERSRI